MITGKWLRGSEDLTPALKVRQDVFVTEQGFPAETERDEYDERAVHALLFDEDGNPAATGRLFVDDDGYWRIGRMAVEKHLRGMQLGDLLIRMLLDKALGAGAQRLRVSAQRQAEGFYAKYGFAPYGETYDEDGVPHVAMEATDGSVRAACFSGCGGHCGS